MAVEQLARQTAGAHRGLGVEAAGGVGQDGVALWWQHLEDVGLVGVLADVGASHGDGDDLGAAGVDRLAGLVCVLVLAGADQQARAVLAAGDGEGVC